MKAWQVSFTITRPEWLLTEGLLSDVFPALTVRPMIEGDPHSDEMICLIFPEAPEEDQLQKELEYIFGTFDLPVPTCVIEALPDMDWLQHVYEQLKPIEAGRFFVHGSHIDGTVPLDKVAVLIEAATAFGTGEHPTTKGCLLAFDKLLETKQPKNILDMGCGSGILAIAAAKTCDATIIGTDIDVNSVTVSRNHARDNHVADQIDFIAGDGFRVPEIAQRASYDLIFGNILAQPLIDMASALCAVASGDIILSGFTRKQTPYVEKAYTALGCRVIQQDAIQDEIDEWVALWLSIK